MRKAYPSDISRVQYEMIKEELENCRKKTRPREYDLYEIFCAVLYVVKEGCTWRALPHDFPEYNSVYYYFSIWSKKEKFGVSILDNVLGELVKMERLANEREAVPRMLIIDSKSIQNADTADECGYDGGKKNGSEAAYRSRYTWSASHNHGYTGKCN
jgi:transposase